MSRTAWDTEAPEAPHLDFVRAARAEIDQEKKGEEDRRVRERAAQLEKEAKAARVAAQKKARKDRDRLRPEYEHAAREAEEVQRLYKTKLDLLYSKRHEYEAANNGVETYDRENVARRQEIEAAVAAGRSILEAVMQPVKVTEAMLDAERRENTERRKAERHEAERKRTVAELLERARQADALGNVVTANDLRRQARQYGWDGRE